MIHLGGHIPPVPPVIHSYRGKAKDKEDEMVNIRSKGQRGEREAAALVASWANEVLRGLGLPEVELKRNLQQSQEGGYDVVGFDWLAMEVKRHESLAQLSQWWKQTLKQAGDGQVPFLMYRQNRSPWRFRIKAPVAHPKGAVLLTIDLAEDDARLWMQWQVWSRYSG